MKDFDVERDQREERGRISFKICGQEFHCRYGVAPDQLADYLEMGAETPEVEAIAILDRTIQAFIVPEERERWSAVRDPELDNPITLDDITSLIRWLLAEATGRPISPPSDSSRADGGNGTGSTERSLQPVAVEPQG